MNKKVLISLILILAIAMLSSSVYAICGGNYTSGGWTINSTMLCQDETIIVTGPLLVQDDTVTEVITFTEDDATAHYNLSNNESEITLATPDLNAGTPSSYTDNWLSGVPGQTFVISMNESSHAISAMVTNSNNASFAYFIWVDDSDTSGCDSPGPGKCNSDGVGSDFLIGIVPPPTNGMVIQYWNNSASAWGNVTVSGEIVTNVYDPDLQQNFSVYFNTSQGPTGTQIEVVVNTTGPWIDKKVLVTDYDDLEQITTFRNRSLAVAALGSLTLNNVDLQIADMLNIAVLGSFYAYDSNITFNLTGNGTSNFSINANTNVFLNNTKVLSNDSGLYYGFGSNAANINISNCQISNSGVTDSDLIPPSHENFFDSISSGTIFNNNYSSCHPSLTCLRLETVSDINVSNNEFFGTTQLGAVTNGYFENNIYSSNLQVNIIQTNLNFTNNTFLGSLQIAQGGASGMYLINNNFSGTPTSPIDDQNNTATNTLVYSNANGKIMWEDKSNLTIDQTLTSPTVSTPEGPLYIANNLIGFNATTPLNQLNTSANISFYGLNYSLQPQLFKDGVRCDNETTCNITSYSGGTLTADIIGFSNYTTVTTDVSCGTITTSQTMNLNVNATQTCFNIGADDLVLDCAGFTINYSTNGLIGFAVNNTAYNNLTVKNCIIIKGNSSGDETEGIHIENTSNSIIQNNTVTTTGADSVGINIGELGSNNLVENNTVTTIGVDSFGIIVDSTDNNVSNNTVTTSGTDSYGIYLNGDRNIVNVNTINTTGTDANGIEVEDCADNLIFDNVITGLSSYLIGLEPKGGGIMNNVLTNNTGSSGLGSLLDGSDADNNNTLIFSNEFGAINWTLGNLTTGLNLSVGSTVFLENNIIGMLDDNAMPELNGTSTITFYGLTHASTPELHRNGVRCDDGNTCNITSYSSGTGTLIANVSSFSNYTTYMPSSSSNPTTGGGSPNRDSDDTTTETEEETATDEESLQDILKKWEEQEKKAAADALVEGYSSNTEAEDETEEEFEQDEESISSLISEDEQLKSEEATEEKNIVGKAFNKLFVGKGKKGVVGLIAMLFVLGTLLYLIRKNPKNNS
ncbi:hypothetical protein HN695_04160 [Candidatus Woesearchaeota archaeon]|nr:hypothetical protein [Candidatus Woesearchaeota archaeon]MBT5272343.1 hypothetical protein [Candidatus Woesearchaeota archaeon]MBT6041311.1 hypothetical protein [Candidatus Woesearchaeota archaeon]MBT6336615.1 hypothetical protein [Candidatus Woesearchaeota archaeon]MBT7927505.1 hypothetical protein [Candidatus Woesearchaeota archaeon]